MRHHHRNHAAGFEPRKPTQRKRHGEFVVEPQGVQKGGFRSRSVLFGLHRAAPGFGEHRIGAIVSEKRRQILREILSLRQNDAKAQEFPLPGFGRGTDPGEAGYGARKSSVAGGVGAQREASRLAAAREKRGGQTVSMTSVNDFRLIDLLFHALLLSPANDVFETFSFAV